MLFMCWFKCSFALHQMYSKLEFRLNPTAQEEIYQILKLLHLFISTNGGPIRQNLLEAISFQNGSLDKEIPPWIDKLCFSTTDHVTDIQGYICRSRVNSLRKRELEETKYKHNSF